MDFHALKRKQLQALCKKHKIPANLTNLEMANGLTSLLKGKDKLFTERRSCLKALYENGCEIESDVENKRVKKVRFSRETHMIEFEKSEAKAFEVRRRGRGKSVINEVSIVENVGGPELSEGVGHAPRSRDKRLVDEGVAERKGGKRGVRDDMVGSNLPLAADSVAPIDVDNEESGVMTRASRRKREVMDEGKRKQEDMEKGLKNRERERNLKQGNDKARGNVAERGESDVECVEVPAEKVLRRTRRNVKKVESNELMGSGNFATGSSLKPVDLAVNDGSGPSGLDIDAAMEVKERSRVRVATRRLTRNASRNVPLITLDDLVAEVNYERKMKKQRRDPVMEDEAILVDSITVELPFAPSSRNVRRSEKAAPAIAAGKSAQIAKRKSKKQIIEIQDSSPENLATNELPDVDVRPSLTEVAESTIHRDSENEGFVDNLKKQKKRSGKNSGRKSPPKVQDSSNCVTREVTASETTELDDIELGTETSHCQTKMVAQDAKVTQEIKKNSMEHLVLNCYSDEPAADCPCAIAEQYFEDSSAVADVISSEKLSMADSCMPIGQSDSTDPKGIQLWVELSINMETTSRPALLDHLVKDEGISSDKSQEYIEHKGLETTPVDVLERYGNASLNVSFEKDRSTSLVKDKTCEVNPANSEDANPNYNGDCSSTLSSGRALEQRDLSLSMQTNDGEVDNVAGDSNFDQEELKCTVSAKSVEHNPLEENYDASDKFYESSFPEPSRSVSRMLDDGNVNGKEDSEEPADLKGNRLGSPSKAGTIMETRCTRIEYSTGTSIFENTTYALEFNLTSDDPVSGTIVEGGYSFLQDTNAQKQEKSADMMDLGKHLEPRKQSLSIQRGPGDAAEAEKHFADVKISAELPKFDEEKNILGKFWQPNPFDSPGCELGMLGNQDANAGRDFVGDVDSERLILAAEDFASHTIDESKETYKDEPEKDGDTEVIESYIRGTEKVDNNFEEPANSEVSMAAVISGTGQILHTPTGDYIEDFTTTTMKLDMTLEQKGHSPVVCGSECEADGVAEVGRSYGQVELKRDEFSKSIEDRPFDEKHHSPRSLLQGGEDSIECQKNSTSSRKTFEGPHKDGNIGFTDSHIIKKCISVQIAGNSEEVPVYSKNQMEGVISATGNFSHIPLVDNNEHTGSRDSDVALDQRVQSPVLQINGSHVDNVAEEERSHDQLELYCDESAESVEDRCLEEQYQLPNKCLVSNISYSSRRGASRMLQDEIIRDGEDPVKCQERSYEVAPKENGNAGSIESYVIDKYIAPKNYEDNPESSKDAMEEISGTVNCAHVVEGCISTMNLEITLEKREQSPAAQQNGCETDIVAEEDGNHEHKELSCDESAKSFEDRPSEEKCDSPDKCWKPSASDRSGRMLEDKSVNAGEDVNKSTDFLGTTIVAPSLAAEAVERNCLTTEFSSSISNLGCTYPLDSTPTLDGPVFKEVSGDVNKRGHLTFPDTSAKKQEDIMDAMEQSSNKLTVVANDVADALKTCEEVNNYDLASSETGNNNAEDVVDGKFQDVVLAVQRRSSYVIEASGTNAEGVHSPPSDNDTKQQGLTAEDNDGISEEISDFAGTKLSEVKFNINNFQEEFSCKDQEDNAKEKREDMAATFSQVQFTMSDIHSEEKIVDIADDVSSKSYKHHDMLKESDVADTINEYIESESTMNPSLRIDDARETLHIGVLTKVPEAEHKNAEETIDTTGRKYEFPVERDDEEKGEAADLEETALGSAWISDSKSATTQGKNSDVVADKNIFLGKQFTCENTEKNMRAILIHGTPKKLPMVADMKENLPSLKMGKIGCLTTVKPTTKRPALKDVLQKK